MIVKAADGRTRLPQFSPPLVARLKAHGLKVCAYQRLRGRFPRTEAERRRRRPGWAPTAW